MQRKIEFSSSFLKQSGKPVNKNPHLYDRLEKTIKDLADDPFTPSLKTHPLKGKLEAIEVLSESIGQKAID